MTPDELTARLRDEAAVHHHASHPFHRAMHDGSLTPGQLAGWVANRFYYQTRAPINDALILAKSEDPAFRRAWLRRIVDHDGVQGDDGGLELWLRLAEGVGLPRAYVQSFDGVLPAVRAACDEHVDLVRASSLVESVASSLTDLFAPDLLAARIAAWERHYRWVNPGVLAYFRTRLARAKRDGGETLGFVLEQAQTREVQDRCVAAFRAKCRTLWRLLDAVAERYGIGEPRQRSP